MVNSRDDGVVSLNAMMYIHVAGHDLPKIVAAYCVLHNICEINGENFNDGWMKDIHTS